jgi:hypothetical protein
VGKIPFDKYVTGWVNISKLFPIGFKPIGNNFYFLKTWYM